MLVMLTLSRAKVTVSTVSYVAKVVSVTASDGFFLVVRVFSVSTSYICAFNLYIYLVLFSRLVTCCVNLSIDVM